MVDPELSPYLFNPDEAYSTGAGFDEIVRFIEYVSHERKKDNDQEYQFFEDILVVQVSEGVFIRAKSKGWCELLSDLANDNKQFPLLSIISITKWESIMRIYKFPDKSFGNEKLARWKVGF